ncbi:MAG: type IV pilus biogenesis/stability protein PilW [Methyloglobulus sp.]|nr:type IV pilus biogenesis/stability protein PilW [Methyloglobulus sp.]
MPLKSLNKITRVTVGLLSMTLVACSWFSAGSDEKPTDVYMQLGVRYMELNKLELAKENLQKAVDKDSDNYRAHSALGYLYEKINKLDNAKQHYEAALSIAPDDAGVQNNFGRFLCERRQFDKGLALLIQAGDNMLNDKQWLALTNAGRCQLGMGQRDKAITYLRQALALNDRYAPALFEMQRISYEIGEYRASEDYLQRYLGEANHTPETLWIGIQTEQALGNSSLANEYRNLLLDKFPDSNEAKQVSGIR